LKALVTGAGGFLGRYIVEHLVARGDTVRGFSRKWYPELDQLGVESIQGDIRNAQQVASACEGCEVIFHTAAVAGIWGPWEHFYGINTLGTKHVVAGCLQHGARKLIYTSSPSVTFDGSEQESVDETAPYPKTWLCHYPHTKALAEQLVLEANGTNGLRTCSLRPHLIWGPRDQHLIPRLLDRARRGRLRRVGDGSNLVDMIYVENAAEAHLQAAEHLVRDSAVCGRAYFISQDEPVNCWEWIDDILTLAGLPKVPKAISFKSAWRIGAMMEAAYQMLRIKNEPVMTRFLAAQLAKSHYFDISRAKNDFGYSPSISTVEGMRRLGEELAPQSRPQP